jgi:predicted metal-dependent hydrolase
MKSLDNKSFMMLFDEGKDLFNQEKIHEAHLTWEKIWKHGDNNTRKNIKGFIQLSGSLLNQSYGKQKAAEYLMEKAKNNIIESEMLSNKVNVRNIIKQINEFIVFTHDGVCCGSSVTITL